MAEPGLGDVLAASTNFLFLSANVDLKTALACSKFPRLVAGGNIR